MKSANQETHVSKRYMQIVTICMIWSTSHSVASFVTSMSSNIRKGRSKPIRNCANRKIRNYDKGTRSEEISWYQIQYEEKEKLNADFSHCKNYSRPRILRPCNSQVPGVGMIIRGYISSMMHVRCGSCLISKTEKRLAVKPNENPCQVQQGLCQPVRLYRVYKRILPP